MKQSDRWSLLAFLSMIGAGAFFIGDLYNTYRYFRFGDELELLWVVGVFAAYSTYVGCVNVAMKYEDRGD